MLTELYLIKTSTYFIFFRAHSKKRSSLNSLMNSLPFSLINTYLPLDYNTESQIAT